MVTSGSLTVSGPPVGPDEWLEERWIISGTQLGSPTAGGRMHRRVRRTMADDYLIEDWNGPNMEQRQLFRFTAEEIRNRRPDRFWHTDERALPFALEALPLQGEVRVGEPAPFIIPFLRNLAVPLIKEDRIATRVARIEQDTVVVDIAYSTGSPPKGQESGFREVDSLTGSLALSLSTGRPMRLQYNSRGTEWVYRFGGRIEPWEFTDDIHCEWTYAREPSAPVTVP